MKCFVSIPLSVHDVIREEYMLVIHTVNTEVRRGWLVRLDWVLYMNIDIFIATALPKQKQKIKKGWKRKENEDEKEREI